MRTPKTSVHCDSRPGIKMDDESTKVDREQRIRRYAANYAAGLHIYDGTPIRGLKPAKSKSARIKAKRAIRRQMARQISLFANIGKD